jgi:hypothetical protein
MIAVAIDAVPSPTNEHAAPWWYRLLARLFPSRCREIPEAQNPDRIVLRQFAIVKRYAYLQQFASDEDDRYMHSHPYRFMLAIGLWGGYTEHRIAGESKRRTAPYLYALDGGHVHHVQDVSPGHTSVFIGIGRAADGTVGDKRYFGVPVECPPLGTMAFDRPPLTLRRLWTDHIKVKVARI